MKNEGPDVCVGTHLSSCFRLAKYICHSIESEVYICRRHDLTDDLKKLQCKTLIFVGESSPFHTESVHMSTKIGRKNCTLIEVECSLQS